MRRSTSVLLLSGLIIGLPACQGPAKVERKKMPQFNSLGISEEGTRSLQSIEGLVFYTRNVTISTDEGMRDYLAVALPDPAYDSAATQLMLHNLPMAAGLVKQWALTQKKGICIDLRAGEGGAENEHRADYTLRTPDGVSLPVIFLWDHAAAGRAGNLISLMQSTEAIGFRRAETDAASF